MFGDDTRSDACFLGRFCAGYLFGEYSRLMSRLYDNENAMQYVCSNFTTITPRLWQDSRNSSIDDSTSETD